MVEVGYNNHLHQQKSSANRAGMRAKRRED